MLRVVFAVVLGLAVAMGGVVAVADAAGPGDLLFGVDRAVEQVRLRLTTDGVAEARLRLEFAVERLEEAELELTTDGNLQNVEVALAAFNTALADLQPLLDQLTPEQRTMVQEAFAYLLSSREGIVQLGIEIVDGETEFELELDADGDEIEEKDPDELEDVEDEAECENEEAEDAEAGDADEAENEDAEAHDVDEGEDQDAEAEDADDGEDEDAEAEDADDGEDEDAEAEVEDESEAETVHEDDEAGC